MDPRITGSRAQLFDAIAPSPYGPVVLGNIEDDFHALGRRMVGLFVRSVGWEVIDLGNDVPTTAFINAAKTYKARVIDASAMMYTTAKNIRILREMLTDHGLVPHLRLAVGGDGSSPSARTAPNHVAELGKRSLQAELTR